MNPHTGEIVLVRRSGQHHSLSQYPEPPAEGEPAATVSQAQAALAAAIERWAVSTGQQTEQDQAQQTRSTDDEDQPSDLDGTHESGNVNAADGADDPAGDAVPRETAKEARRRVWSRFAKEGRDLATLGIQRDEMLGLAKESIPDREERLLWVYNELDRLYPAPDGERKNPAENAETCRQMAASFPENGRKSEDQVLGRSEGQIQGLGDIPAHWPEMPATASLGADLGWVQANRLRIVEERPGRATLVRLALALSPAPSWAALGWLETSIRSYAKFVDVAAKAAASDEGESSVVRRERLAIEEVRALLAEMQADVANGPCPRCGRSG